MEFRGLCHQDGPTAFRLASLASLFPSGINVAASWDRNLAYQRGFELGQEFRDKGVHVAYGPVVGPLGRNALGGRNWEGFSPDPYLTGAMAEQTVQGMQSGGVQAVTKHLIGNEQETQRNPTPQLLGPTIEAVSSNIDDRTMHELYLWPFADAVRAGSAGIMCSYNRLNSSYACQNSKVLNGLLKDELAFQGFVVSDYGAVHAGVATANAGMDMNMPGGDTAFTTRPSLWDTNLVNAVNNGSVAESRVNDMVLRVLTPYFYLNQDATTYPYVDASTIDQTPIPNPSVDLSLLGPPLLRDVRADHADLIRELGAAATVLIKNTNGSLPLDHPRSVTVFGNDQGDPTQALPNSLGDYSYGTLPVGGGSGTGRASYIVTPLEALQTQATADGTELVNYPGNVGPPPGFTPPDTCLVFLRTFAQEGSDRTSLLPDDDGADTVTSVAAECANTIVVTHSGGINTLPFANNPNVTAILVAHYPGQEIGNAIVDVLYGRTEPQGRLPYTIALSEDDYNTQIADASGTSDPNGWQSYFTEGLEVDYRYFDAAAKDVAFEFGFGLGYADFSLERVTATATASDVSPLPPAADARPGGNPRLWDVLYTVSCTVTNMGERAGSTIAQLYVDMRQGAPNGTPPRQLRAFEKISLQPGESKDVMFELNRRDMSFWDVLIQDWRLAQEVSVSVGFSSRDLRGSTSFNVL